MKWREENIGNARLILGDCREILPTLGKVDAVVTDPPYGIGAGKSGHMHGGTSSAKWTNARRVDYGPQSWDAATVPNAVAAAVYLARHSIIFGGNYYDLPPSSCWLVWDKQNTGEYADCELAWTNLDKAVRRIYWRWNGMIRKGHEERFHPTQKPEGVMDWCLTHLPPDVATVCDPFMGSGTTGVACIKRGMTFTGIERDEHYFDIACRRIEEAYKQPRLFAEPKQTPVQTSLLDGAA